MPHQRVVLVLMSLMCIQQSHVVAQEASRFSTWGEFGVASAKTLPGQAQDGPAFSYGAGRLRGTRTTWGFETGIVTAGTTWQLSLEGVVYLHPAGHWGPFLKAGLGPVSRVTDPLETWHFDWGVALELATGWDIPLGSRLAARPFVSVTRGVFDAVESVRVLGLGLSWLP